MSTNQETMRATIAAAHAAKDAAVVTAEMQRQATVDAKLSLVGYRPGFPGTAASAVAGATYASAVKAANAQKRIDLIAAEIAKQAAISTAKDLLRSQGEIPF
jgi:hypothetical protein